MTHAASNAHALDGSFGSCWVFVVRWWCPTLYGAVGTTITALEVSSFSGTAPAPRLSRRATKSAKSVAGICTCVDVSKSRTICAKWSRKWRSVGRQAMGTRRRRQLVFLSPAEKQNHNSIFRVRRQHPRRTNRHDYPAVVVRVARCYVRCGCYSRDMSLGIVRYRGSFHA